MEMKSRMARCKTDTEIRNALLYENWALREGMNYFKERYTAAMASIRRRNQVCEAQDKRIDQLERELDEAKREAARYG